MRFSWTMSIRLGVSSASGLLLPQVGYAQEASAAAQMLFEEGRDALRAGHVEQACPKLAESQRLSPATGTLLALAMCHEAQGKLASAWAEYAEVAVRAAREGQATREEHARSKVQELKPRLSSLEVRLSTVIAAYPGVQVRRNGMALGEGAWNTAVPVDGGEYELLVTAPGRKSWRSTIAVARERAMMVSVVPELAELSRTDEVQTQLVTQDAPASPKVTPQLSAAPLGAEETSTLEWSGMTFAGAGVASWLVGGGFFYAAIKQKAAYERPCGDASCEPDREENLNRARTYADLATGLGIAGGALVLTGAVLYWWPDDGEPSSTMSSVQVQVGRERTFVGLTGVF